jgi:hypothetical protein
MGQKVVVVGYKAYTVVRIVTAELAYIAVAGSARKEHQGPCGKAVVSTAQGEEEYHSD